MRTMKSLSRNSNSYLSLEERRLLAGNVTVFENVNLYIRGDQADNQLEVVVEDDQLWINGLDGTTINGKESYLVDSAIMTNDGVTFEGGLRAHLGPGHDDFMIRDAQFEAMSLVYGGTGNDDIGVVDSTFLDQAIFQTYEGNDQISTNGSHFKNTFRALTLDGQDSVSMIETVFDGGSIVATGEHKDFIHSEGNHYMGEVNLVLPLNGDDTVQLNNPVVGEHQLGVFLGNGDDAFGTDMNDASVEGTIVISGQAGTDEVLEMSMNEDAEDQTSVWSLEKNELVFESALGGFANVTEAASSYTTTFEPGSERETTYIEQYATPVVLEETQTISQIEWSGTYVRDYFYHGSELEDRGDSFFVQIFEDGGDGVPDVDSAVTFEVGEANRVVLGEIEIVYYGETPLYGYHAEIDYAMEAGKQYWVSIFTELDGEEFEYQNHWEWGLGIDSDADSTVFNQGYDDHANDWLWHESPYTIHELEMDLRLRA